jgi:hypothetical protein
MRKPRKQVPKYLATLLAEQRQPVAVDQRVAI